jgi:hypothetical protein
MLEIAVATHKKIKCELPDGYHFMQVNCAGTKEHWSGYLHDDAGENISEKNFCYCELSAMYWLWKNSSADYKGLCHYRRYFSRQDRIYMKEWSVTRLGKLRSEILSEQEIQGYLKDHDAILVQPYLPYPDTEQTDLERYCYAGDIDHLTEVITEYYPAYASSYHQVMQSKNLSHYNMLIASREIFDAYCEWLFDILEKVEKRCDITGYDVQHKRIYGYFGEVLLNVYLEKHQLKCKYVRALYVAEFIQGVKPVPFVIYTRLKERIFDIIMKIGGEKGITRIYSGRHSAGYQRLCACACKVQKDAIEKAGK